MSHPTHILVPYRPAAPSRGLGARAPWLLSLWLAVAATPGCLFSENFAEKPLRTSANGNPNNLTPDAGQPDGGGLANNPTNNASTPAPGPENTYVMPVSATGRARSANYQLQLRVGEGPATGSAQAPQGSVRLGAPAPPSPSAAPDQP